MQINPLGTIQGKFTLYLSGLIVVIMSGLSFWAISREKRLIENAIIREGKALVESFAVSCTNTLMYEEIGLIDEGGLLDSYISDLMQKRSPRVEYALVVNVKGKVIAHSNPYETGNTYQDYITRRALASWETLVQRPSAFLLDISAPLAISTKRWGTLMVGISLEEMRNEISTLALKYVLFTILFIIVAIAVNAFLFGLITRPLKALAEEMDSVRFRNDVSARPVERRDEIAVLQQSFYRMLKNLKAEEAERERTQRNLFLTEKMAAIGKLTAGVAHEINNPLGGILNCIYHFKKGGQSAGKQVEYLNLMEDGVRRIQQRVKNLLEYARHPNPERSATDFRFLAERSLSLLEYQLQHKRIKVELEIPADIPTVEIDGDRIGEVLVNLFLNAVQSMPEGGVLRVVAQVVADRFVVTVSDTGMGIPEEILPQVCDPFFTTKPAGKGTGLGLWLSQVIVEGHAGTLHIASRQGEGTKVEISLPFINRGVL